MTYDNGEEYEMNDQKGIAIFDSYEKAVIYAQSKGFNPYEGSSDVFYREHSNRHERLKFKDFLYIDKFEMNTVKDF